MFVVATAGHVDHGKSTLVNALTGMEPDRWAEEQRRGLTIDLGFGWTTLPSGREVSFVDVPGHERFITNMLAGVGPAPVVCFVVAADQGWQQQSTDHFDAIGVLGIEHGIIALTRCDLATEHLDHIVAGIRERIADTRLADAPIVPVSARTGTGIDALREHLDELLGTLPAPDPTGRLRMWIDRAFSITGAGTVVTGTLATGTLAVGEELLIHTPAGPHTATIRGLQSRNHSVDSVGPCNRVAVNLRGISTEQMGRGDALLHRDEWFLGTSFDARQLSFDHRDPAELLRLDQLPEKVTLHLGTAAVQTHLRAFDADHARFTLDTPLPLQVGDRLILRVPGSEYRIGGIEVLDLDPPALRRRGDGATRLRQLRAMPTGGDALALIHRHGRINLTELAKRGLHTPESLPAEALLIGEELVSTMALERWAEVLTAALEDQAKADPLSPWLSQGQAGQLTGLPVGPVLADVIKRSGATVEQGRLRSQHAAPSLGTAEAGIASLEQRLANEPFAAPEAAELQKLKLGVKELTAAERQGRILRLDGGIVLLPKAPAQAMRELAQLEQPFTTSAARQALGTTRRVAIPLLEYLDERGWTERIDAGKRVVVR